MYRRELWLIEFNALPRIKPHSTPLSSQLTQGSSNLSLGGLTRIQDNNIFVLANSKFRSIAWPMITNERQYKITRACLRDFTEALERLSDLPASRKQPWLRTAQRDSIEEQIKRLQLQIDEYEKLKAGKVDLPDPVSLVSQTPLVLIQTRIAKGWDQEELASRLGMAKQQIQRYEQNNYAQATLSILTRVAAVLTGQPDSEIHIAPTTKAAKSKSSTVKAKEREQETKKTKKRASSPNDPKKKATPKKKQK